VIANGPVALIATTPVRNLAHPIRRFVLSSFALKLSAQFANQAHPILNHIPHW
jgi:hypothetical protein